MSKDNQFAKKLTKQFLSINSSIESYFNSLNLFWSQNGCLLLQPYDTEKGAGTMSPHTFLRAVGPEPWSVAYPEPCRRPSDGR